MTQKIKNTQLKQNLKIRLMPETVKMAKIVAIQENKSVSELIETLLLENIERKSLSIKDL